MTEILVEAPDVASMERVLLERLAELGSTIVAYSGGVDSAVLAVAANKALGERALAVIGVSPSLAGGELSEALDVARTLGFRVEQLVTNEIERPGYVANAGDRCFHCKSELYDLLTAKAEQESFATVCDGRHRDDDGDHRPGQIAAKARGVRSPLWDVGFGKAAVRALAEHWGLPVWNKPASACLSSRIPVGTTVTVERLAQVEHAEAVLRSVGFRGSRVRWRDGMAVIELLPQDFSLALDSAIREKLIAGVKAAGFARVTLDLEGYRRGG